MAKLFDFQFRGGHDAPPWWAYPAAWGGWSDRGASWFDGSGVDVDIDGAMPFLTTGRGPDDVRVGGDAGWLWTWRGDDDVWIGGNAGWVNTWRGDDDVRVDGDVGVLRTGRGDDAVTFGGGSGWIHLGRGDDRLELAAVGVTADGGAGFDRLVTAQGLEAFDVVVADGRVTLHDVSRGATTELSGFEAFAFAGTEYTVAELARASAAPEIRVADGTQAVTVENDDPTVSVIWDRAVQQAVIETDSAVGPTVASRAYALLHTAIYDAWASYDPVAVRVSFDLDGDNAANAEDAIATDANKAKAMSFAAFTVLNELFPDQSASFAEVMALELGYPLVDDGSQEALIGLDAAEDLMGLRRVDGSNQLGGYESDAYTPVNPHPNAITDITRWTPESVPIDPEDDDPEQSFLTPQWQEVESFALPEDATGATVYDGIRPPPPEPFFTAAFAGSTLDLAAATITLAAPLVLDGESLAAGETVAVSNELIGEVINPGFIEQAEVVIDFSANLDDLGKIDAEFWEDGAGTAFPPGTFMTFAQYVSARDDHDLDQDAALFLAMGNAVMDAGIAAWESKIFYDYVRPVRAIRDLGELGLIGELGVDELTGESGYVVEAFGGFDPVTGDGLGTRTILAENFQTFQRPFSEPSPPFAEYVSGHSTFSASGAEVLRLFTGSDAFGGSVTFAPGSTQFEAGVPAEETTIAWETFTDAADDAGLSRLFGGIHFEQGDEDGRDLGRAVGASAYELAQSFVDGTATDADRPFFGEPDLLM